MPCPTPTHMVVMPRWARRSRSSSAAVSTSRDASYQRLRDTRDIFVAEDPPAARYQPLLHPVPLAVLIRQETHQGLGNGETDTNGGQGGTTCCQVTFAFTISPA